MLKLGYHSSKELYYCPLWTHPYWKLGKWNPSDKKQAGLPKEGQTFKPTYYKTSYIYRSYLPNGRSPSPEFGESSDPFLADFWTKEVYKYSHEGVEYNVAYLGGHVKHKFDKGKTIGSSAFKRTKHNQLVQQWDTFFKN